MQIVLEQLMEWKLLVNLEITKGMVCSTRKPKICHGFYYNNSIVEITGWNNFTIKWQLIQACDDLAARAKKVFFVLKRKLLFDSNLSPNLWLKLYNSIIVPILTYS